jgi:hypothetical protein
MTIYVAILIIVISVALICVLQWVMYDPNEGRPNEQYHARFRHLQERRLTATMDELIANPPTTIISTSFGFGEELWAMYGDEETCRRTGSGLDAYLMGAKLVDTCGMNETVETLARSLGCRPVYWHIDV